MQCIAIPLQGLENEYDRLLETNEGLQKKLSRLDSSFESSGDQRGWKKDWWWKHAMFNHVTHIIYLRVWIFHRPKFSCCSPPWWRPSLNADVRETLNYSGLLRLKIAYSSRRHTEWLGLYDWFCILGSLIYEVAIIIIGILLASCLCFRAQWLFWRIRKEG